MKEKTIVKKAGVLLFAFLMMISSGLALAKTTSDKITLYTTEAAPTTPSTMNNALVWDNGVGYKVGMLAAQYFPGDLDAFPADDFQLTDTYNINSVFWQGGYYNTQYASGNHDYNFNWNITFFTNAAGDKPGAVYTTYALPNASITRQFWYSTSTSWRANYTVTLSPPIKIYANQKYWLTIYAYNATFPQSGWCRHNQSVGGIKLHEGMFKSAYFGFPDWVNTSNPGLIGMPCDFNYQLFGDIAPTPILSIDSIKGGFGVKATIKNSGNGDANDVNWNITLKGGLIILGKVTNGTLTTIAAGSTADVKSKLILGIGKTVVTVTAICVGSSATKSVNATVFIVFVLGIK